MIPPKICTNTVLNTVGAVCENIPVLDLHSNRSRFMQISAIILTQALRENISVSRKIQNPKLIIALVPIGFPIAVRCFVRRSVLIRKCSKPTSETDGCPNIKRIELVTFISDAQVVVFVVSMMPKQSFCCSSGDLA